MTQILEPDDNYNQTSGVQGDAPAMWVRAKAWQWQVAYTGNPGGPGGLQWTLNFPATSEMVDRYFGSPQGGGFVLDVPFDLDYDREATPAVFTNDSVTVGKEHGTAVLRGAYGENVNMRASFYTIQSKPSYIVNDIGACGIGARIQNGTVALSGTPDNERIEDLDGYWFILGMDSFQEGGPTDLTCDFQIVRVNTGVVTLLRSAESDNGSGFAYAKNYFEGGRQFRLRFEVETNGAQVDLTGYFTPYWGDVGHNGVEQTLVTWSDTDANRITGSGRFGVFNAREWNDGVRTNVTAPCISYVMASHLSTGNLIFRDEWKRRYYNACHTRTSTVPPTATQDCNTLNCGFLGDNFGDDLNRGRIIFDAAMPGGGEGLEFDYTQMIVPNGDKLCTCVMMRPADDPVKQDRQIELYFDSTGNATLKTGTSDDNDSDDGTRSVGIVLRESGYVQNSFTDPEVRNGYLVSLSRQDGLGAPWHALKLYSFNDGVRRQLAAHALTSSLDTWYTLRVQIDSVAGPGGLIDDAAQIKIFIDTVQQIITSTSSGVTIDASGTIWDERSDRILSGAGEGFRVNTAHASASPRKTYLDNWQQGADSGPDDPDEADQPSIAVGSETDGATGTLELPADWPVTLDETYDRIEHVFEYREYRYANARMREPRRTWTVKAQAITDTQRAALRLFWKEHNGVELGYTWVEPDDAESVTCHFRDDAIATALRNPGVNSFEFQIEELF